MQTFLSVLVLLALIAMGVLFLLRVNAQTSGRPTPHRYTHLKESFQHRLHHRHGHETGTDPQARTGSPPPPSREPRGGR
ncbi:hypothetical protein MUU72_11935 [Streptomyces sp. RS10V-4]|uniref:hypothetical protein n=1 Tax=Streptomyces rhizoryzae TaxID=2932493 RepID=UPI002004AE94|nr:hypothetical protein [Streptomyces rhizoryzae]MCK7623798.1 hypothetical protein [Streptomyces rhizoryzae]